MNLNATIDTETHRQREVASGIPSGEAARPSGFIERWLHAHLNAVAIAIVSGGLVARIVLARKTFFNPDEVLHYLMINEPSLRLAYKASLTNAHPPLIYLLLYICHLLGRSEFILRLPLILAGTAFCWFAFKWVQALFGEAASLIALIVVAFSPTLIALSAEVREYALLLFCMTAALYFLERAFDQKSVRAMWLFSSFLYLAILSHYSAAFFALTAGIYALARIADYRWPRKLTIAWIVGQVGGVGIYLLLYLTHISKIRNNLAVWSTSFGDTLYQFDQESIFHFTRTNTWNIFQYILAQRYVAEAMLIGFVLCAGFLLLRDFRSSAATRVPRHASILLLLPFAAIWAAAIRGIYPYVGSRHTIILAPFAIAAASFLFAAMCRQKLWAGVLVGTLLVGISSLYGQCPEPGITQANQRRDLMIGAVNDIRQSARQGDVILADMESAIPLTYYYCKTEEGFFFTWSRTNFGPFNCNEHLIVPLFFWYLRPEGLAGAFEKTVHSNGLKPGDRVWIFQAGWGGNLMAKLPQSLVQFRCVTPSTFGENITVVPVTVAPDLSPAPLSKCPD
jgi:Dolichyl-phosphate-mannose-protein mannosyltransferase